MPMVDGKKFAYTAKGKKMAKAAADKKKKKKMPMKKMRTCSYGKNLHDKSLNVALKTCRCSDCKK
jgi:hypothetical protein